MESREAVIIRNSKRDNLQISWDEEDGFMLLFTPDMADTDNHFHVELTDNEATRLSLFVRKNWANSQQPIKKNEFRKFWGYNQEN
jgi:hypothetical protein